MSERTQIWPTRQLNWLTVRNNQILCLEWLSSAFKVHSSILARVAVQSR